MAAAKKQVRKETRRIQTGTLYRSAGIETRGVDADARTVEIAFSSEEPVERWFGQEILDHAPSSVRLDRIKQHGSLLVDHSSRDQVGRVERISIDRDRVGRALVRFGKSARAEEIWQDVVDGIRTGVSVGYRIHRLVLEESRGDDDDVYRALDWEPYEISLVSVPADASVGVGRSNASEHETIIEGKAMADKDKGKTGAEGERDNGSGSDNGTGTSAAVVERVEIVRNDERERIAAEAGKRERERIAEINAIATSHPECRELADKAVREGTSLNDFRKLAIDEIGKRSGANDPIRLGVPSNEIGLDQRDRQRFSFVRLINALPNPTDPRYQKAAGFEFEVCNAAAEKVGKSRAVRGMLIPWDVLQQPVADARDLLRGQELMRMLFGRDLNVGTATAGGHLVATELLAGSFIELLRNLARILPRSTLLTDLVGNIAIPRQTGGHTAYWVDESTDITSQSDATFDQVTMSPQTVGAYTEISRKLLIQSSIAIEQFVRMDIARTVALELDRVVIEGSGSTPEPRGVLNTVGIGSVAGGSNGSAPTWGDVVDLETAVDIDNALIGDLAYAFNATTVGKLKQTEKASNTAKFIMEGNETNGYPVLKTNQVPSDLTKGSGSNLSAMLFGNWRDVFVGLWSGLDVLVNPYAGDKQGTVRVTALQDADVAVRHPESFAAKKDAITT